MADQSPNPTTPRRGKSAGASGAPSPMDTARLSTPSRLSERASAFESPSKAARSLSQGELPEDPSYAQMLKAVVLYAERLLMFDIPTTYPPPLGEARIIPFMHLNRDPNVVEHTDGDADVLHHALELTPNITIETDRRTGVSWVGAVDEGQWPTNATVVAVVPTAVAADSLQLSTALQGLCSQRFRTVKRAKHPNPTVVDSKDPVEAIMTAAREDIPGPQFIMPADTDAREWHIEFECGAAAIVAYKELAEGGAHARTLPSGDVVHFYAKETDNRVQARIDMAHPVLGLGRGVSNAEVAGAVLRRPPRYGSKRPIKRAVSSAPKHTHRPRNSGKRAASNGAPLQRRAPEPAVAKPNASAVANGRTSSKARRVQRSSTAEPRRPTPQEVDGDLSLMRAMRRSPPKGMSRAQMEEAGLLPPPTHAPPAAAAPTTAPATRGTSTRKAPRASLPSHRGLAPLPTPASGSALNESGDTMPPPQSPTRTHRPYDTPDTHDDRQCYPPEGETWEQDHMHAGHQHQQHHHHAPERYPQQLHHHHHQHHRHQPPQGPSYGPGPGYSYGAGPNAGYPGYGYPGGQVDGDYSDALNEPYPGAFMPTELPAHAAARRAAMYAEYYRSLADSLRPRGPPRYEQTLDLARADRQQRRAKEKAQGQAKDKKGAARAASAASRAASVPPPESQEQAQAEPAKLSRRERSARNREVQEAMIAAAAKAAADRKEAACKAEEEGASVKKKKTRGCRAGHGRNRGGNNARTTPDTEPAPQSEEPGAGTTTGSSTGPSPPAEPAGATTGPSETPAPAAPAAASGAARSFADMLRTGSPASHKPRPTDAAAAAPTSAAAAAAVDAAPAAKPRGPSARAKQNRAAPSS